MKSFAILRTNTGLTTNVKIMVGSDYGLSLDSFDSNYLLSQDKFKRFKFTYENYYDEVLPVYYSELPPDHAFGIKYNNDNFHMNDNFSDQYDDMYLCGGRNIINNKNYEEEYEYFAPLYYSGVGELPSKFIIFRIDGHGLNTIDSSNFKEEIINKLKTVKIFDLTDESNLGKWLKKSFTENDEFPKSPLEIDYKGYEFSKWNGINYNTGGFISKSFYMEEIFSNEREIFGLEKLVFDNYKNLEVIFPNILNLSFLYNDTPSTPDYERNWSLNRYLGFYIDEMEKVTTISPYKLPKLKPNVKIEDNNLIAPIDGDNPFEEEWNNSEPFYIEYNGEFYIVEKYSENRGESVQEVDRVDYTNEEYQANVYYYYKIISDLNLDGKESYINKNYGYINENNILMDENGYHNLDISDADVWLINIDGIYHNIVETRDENGEFCIKINTDYSFKFNINNYEYKVASKVKTVKYLEKFEKDPVKFEIFKLNFTDIKDFDTRIIDTQYSRYEYEKEFEVSTTEENKMYFENPLSRIHPKGYDDFIYDGKVSNIPTSSEYTANKELFKIENDKLSNIWNINPVYCRWVYQNSLSDNDYPYLMNNSKTFGSFNKTVNPYILEPYRSEQNLDYFYTINPYSMIDKGLYLYHSLHVEGYDNNEFIDKKYYFDFDKYLNINYDYDYFTYFFERAQFYDNNQIKNNVKKYSYFNIGDNVIPNTTLFRGIQFDVHNIESVQIESGKITNINIENDNDFEDYKFSIIATDNTTCYMNWDITDTWVLGKEYSTGDIVIYENILYYSIISHSINQPHIIENDIKKKNAPYLNPDKWIPYYYYMDKVKALEYPLYDFIQSANISYDHIFWTPDVGVEQFSMISFTASATPSYIDGSFIYYHNNYYEYNSSNIIDIWNPYETYSIGDLIMYNDKIYKSIINDNKGISPLNTLYWGRDSDDVSLKWRKIPIWNPGAPYLSNNYVIYSDILYKANDNTEIGDEPGYTINWDRIYSFIPNNTTPYNSDMDGNNIIYMNNRYYVYRSYIEKLLTLLFNNLSDVNNFIFNQLLNLDEVYNYFQNIENVNNFITTVHPAIVSNGNYQDCYSDSDNGIDFLNCIESLFEPISIENLKIALINLGEELSKCHLNNGINIYVNKKWKNILINIYINDNTLPYLKNNNRDLIYNELYESLTACNFIQNINDLNNKYGFVNHINYTIIDEDGDYENYNLNNNITELPYIISCNYPDSIETNINSLTYKPILMTFKLKPKLALRNSYIDNIYKLNWYNNIPYAYEIIENDEIRKISSNYNSLSKNINHITLNRFSGFYMPLFHDIDLFNKNSYSRKSGNYIFDTSLTSFGIKKERLLNKINRNGSVLKLRNDEDEISIFPMLDEYGYTIYDWFIFKSTWDKDYHIEIEPSKTFIETHAILKPIFDSYNNFACVTLMQYIYLYVYSYSDFMDLIENYENLNICCPENKLWAFGNYEFMSQTYDPNEYYIQKDEDSGLGLISDEDDISELINLFDTDMMDDIQREFNGLKKKILQWDCNELSMIEYCPNIFDLLYNHYLDFITVIPIESVEEYESFLWDFNKLSLFNEMCCSNCPNIFYAEGNMYSQAEGYISLYGHNGINTLCCSDDKNNFSHYGDGENEYILPSCNKNINIEYKSDFMNLITNIYITDDTLPVDFDLILINPNGDEYKTLYNILNDGDENNFVKYTMLFLMEYMIIADCENILYLRHIIDF